MRKRKRLSFKAFTNLLKKICPIPSPVIIRRVETDFDNSLIPPQRDFGETIDKGDHFYIKINKEDDLRIQKDTLMHEWAHCIAGWGDKKDDHSNAWGIEYAKIYRKIEKSE